MTRGQLAILPVPEGRKSERRIVNLAARLREPGARSEDVEVVNLSVDGFMAQGVTGIEAGSCVWLKLAGLEPQNCRVVWVEEDRAGFEFASPLHAATLELVIAGSRRLAPKGHFGPQGR